jgi:hypothetical protein
MFFSISSPQQSNPTLLHHVKTPNTSNHRHRTQWKSVQQYLPQQEIQKTGLSVQDPTGVQEIITELSDAASEKKQHNGQYKNGT